MNNSRKASFDYTDRAFQELVKLPQVRQAVTKAADDILDIVKATWPSSIGDTPTNNTEGFTHERPKDVFEVIETTNHENRPVALMRVNHPYAVAHQAKTGAFTQAIKAAGYKLVNND